MGDKNEMDKIEAIDKILRCSNGNVGVSGKAKLFLLEEMEENDGVNNLVKIDVDNLFDIFYRSKGYARWRVMHAILEKINIHDLNSEQLDWFIFAHESSYFFEYYDYSEISDWNKRKEDMEVILRDRYWKKYKSKTIEKYHPIFLEMFKNLDPKHPKSNFLMSCLIDLHVQKFMDEFIKLNKEWDKGVEKKEVLLSKGMNLKKFIIPDSIEEAQFAIFLFGCEDKFVIEEAQKINIRC
ncbi:MAG TPA: hypothetical protein PKL98_00320 [Candidatus Pacearchaeota archaeon]|nr:hypothetical protein [Candidatus Pacearchaeota archaeon]HPM08363.1 hypothetical protein [Candidatus Pacearchaeota archaeon]